MGTKVVEDGRNKKQCGKRGEFWGQASFGRAPLMLKVELPAGYKVLLSAPGFDEKSERSSTNSAPRGDYYAVCTYRST